MRENTPGSYGIAAALWFLFGIAVALNLSCAAARPVLGRTLIEQTSSAVAVEVFCTNLAGTAGTYSRGSGSLIAGDRVLTAAHVVECEGISAIRVSQGDAHTLAFPVHVWTTRDTAVLRLGKSFAGSPPPLAKLAPGEVCFEATVPTIARNCGHVFEKHAIECPRNAWCHSFSFTASAIPGNSGSPIYARGKLVGILTGSRPATLGYPGVAYGIAIDGRIFE